MTTSRSFVVIGRWDDECSTHMTLQDFVIQGRSTIPVFSSEETFRQQTAGTPLANEGVMIDGELLRSMLNADDRLILDPGSPTATPMTKAEFDVHVERMAAARP